MPDINAKPYVSCEVAVKSSIVRPYFAAIIMNMTVLAFGMAVGWTSPASPDLQKPTPSLGGDRSFTVEEISWLGSTPFLGGIMATFFWGKFTEIYGRKPAGYAMAVPLIVGWALILGSTCPMLLLIGRFVVGISGMGAIIITPLYVSEFSEDSYRGILGSFIQLSFSIGIVLSYLVGYLLSLPYFTLFCEVIPLIFLVCFYFLPESHVYLWTKGRKSEAKRSLLWFRNGDADKVDKELFQLDTFVSSTSGKIIPFSDLLKYKCNRKAMLISLGLFAFQQFNGILALLTYTSVILQESKNVSITPNAAAVFVGLIQCLASWGSTFIVEKAGRKVLLLISYTGMATTMFTIGLFFYLSKISEESLLPPTVPFLCLCLHAIFYCTAAANLPYVVTSEIFQPEILPLALSVIIFIGSVLSFLSIKIFTYLVIYFDMHGCFWFFMFCCIAAVLFIIFVIPETRGKSMTQVLRILNGDNVRDESRIDYVSVNQNEIPNRDGENC